MDCDEGDNLVVPSNPADDESRSAVNSLVLDYYKKFGRKRDLEQYFSLSTAQSEIRDPSSVFWAKMKTENESSDSGERSDKKSESSQELCRISISFPAQDPYMSQEEDSKTKTESVSPPIIIEEVAQDSSRQNSEDEANKSDDNNSQKSYDVLLDTSLSKHHSPSSSITSQRKLEWDSLADVGYANESDRKTSASSLSTLERLALKQQYSNNDTQVSNLEPPTAHSTPLDENEAKSKNKKGVGKKSTKIYKKDVDFLELSVPHSSNMNPAQSINVNLTKHISFNVEKDGKVTVENVQKDVSVTPEKPASVPVVSPHVRIDKEIQTSLTKTKEMNEPAIPANSQSQPQRIPILISLNTLRTRVRRKKLRIARRKLKSRKRSDKENIPVQEKVGDQPSEAESFEYMPGHIYNQNQLTVNNRPNPADNKSSLESSRAATTDSSKGSKHSFAKDLEKSIDVLKAALQERCDSTIRKQLIKQVCQKFLNSKYRDDDSTTDFLSGLSYSSQKLGLGERNNTTTSTSDTNNSTEASKRPKKSILRSDKFNPGSIASTSQSVPNLPMASKSEKLVSSKLDKKMLASNMDSDLSSKEKTSSDNGFAKTSAEELYIKYLQAYKREEAYKKHLKDKEIFLKQKLVSSDNAFKVPMRVEVKSNNKLKDLMNDLTRNNYDDGSGDASKLEGGPGSNRDYDRYFAHKNQRSHSVFTLSSGNSDNNNKKPNLRKRLQCNIKDLCKPGSSKEQHYCCCPHHSGNLKLCVTDSSAQANMNDDCSGATCPVKQIKHPKQDKIDTPITVATAIPDEATGQIKYVCLCSNKNIPENLLIYKCSKVTNKGIQIEDEATKLTDEVFTHCGNQNCTKRNTEVKSMSKDVINKSSQTNMFMKMLHQSSSDPSITCSNKNQPNADKSSKELCTVSEATRCIQTEISINPKISDPTLSDIVIMSESNCAELISECRRKLSKPSISESKSCQPNGSADSAKSGSYKSSGTSKDVDIELLEEDNPADVLDKEQCVSDKVACPKVNVEPENFTIPIQGTNMTLMVSIAPEFPIANYNKVQKTVNQCEGTEAVKIIEQATSLTEECSKSVQFNKADKSCEFIDHENIKIGNACPSARSGINDTTPSLETYPKTGSINRQKSIQPINTDTDKMGVQTEKVQKNNVGTQEKVPMETQTENILRSDTSNSKDSCTVSKSKTSDFNKKDSPKRCIKNQLLMSKKDSESKKEQQYQSLPRVNRTLDKQNEICACRCGRTKDACKKSHPECKYLLGQQRKPSLVTGKECNNKNDSPDKRKIVNSETPVNCSCGCNGIKDNCMQDCKDLNPTAVDKKRPNLGKRIGGENSLPKKQGEECLCGCGGSKNHCKENCEDNKSTPRDNKTQCKEHFKEPRPVERRTSLGKSTRGKIDSDRQLEKCPCGCDGEKNDCNKNCIRFKSSPRDNVESSWNNYEQGDKEYHLTPRENTLSQERNKVDSLEQQSSNKNSKKSQVYTCSTVSSDNQDNQCSCGCGGTKDNCIEECFQQNLNSRVTTPREVKRKESEDNTVYVARQDLPNRNKGECPCGCGGTKENCREYASGKCFEGQTNKKEVGTQKDLNNEESPRSSVKHYKDKPVIGVNCCGEQTDVKSSAKPSDTEQTDVGSSNKPSEAEQADSSPDPILDMIEKITKKYSKQNVEKNKRKKCFKEIMAVLNYLLETDDKSNDGRRNMCESTSTADETETCTSRKKVPERKNTPNAKKLSEKLPSDKSSKRADKGVQIYPKKLKNPCTTESSELPVSTDIPETSSESNTCKVLDKIKRECDRYHQKRCKIHSGKKCDPNFATSVQCDHCRRVHHCPCRNHKCYKKSIEKINKGSVAYNLILQTSESVASEGTVHECKSRQLKNIIVKIPKKKVDCAPFREMAANFERNIHCSIPCPPCPRPARSKSLPNDSEISSMEDILRKSQGCTVREYLEKNRPDFVESCSQRQSCLKYINESRANERAVKRGLLSLHLSQLPDVTDLNPEELGRLAKDLGRHMRQKQPAPKFISEREMKKHSEKIYKSLPEVVQKKEERKKENIKKTNLLMAHIFKKNLQKKTLRGSVNLSNYSAVIKI